MSQAVIAFLLLAIAGVALVVAGVYLLAGIGWTVIAAGCSLLVGAAFIKTGLRVGNETA